MTFKENTLENYSYNTAVTAKYNKAFALIYPSMLLAGEAGELNNKVQKLIRDSLSKKALTNLHLASALEVLEFYIEQELQDEQFKESVLQEAGDTLWAISQVANDFGSSIQDVAKMNIEKLKSRLERNKIEGSGDNR